MFVRMGFSRCRLAGLILAGFSVAAFAAGAPGAPEQKEGTMAAKRQYGRILVLGNSITWHTPSEKVSWTGNWGMAASAADKDFVHVFADSMAQVSGKRPEVLARNIANFERKYEETDLAALLKEPLAFKADLVVIAIGENVAALDTAEKRSAFQAKLAELATALEANGHPTILVRSCFWANAAKDGVLQAVCTQVGGIYVDISGLGKDEANYARSERKFAHAGVANHPGDRGMRAIADALTAALK